MGGGTVATGGRDFEIARAGFSKILFGPGGWGWAGGAVHGRERRVIGVGPNLSFTPSFPNDRSQPIVDIRSLKTLRRSKLLEER